MTLVLDAARSQAVLFVLRTRYTNVVDAVSILLLAPSDSVP